jgi:hypothetical protein
MTRPSESTAAVPGPTLCRPDVAVAVVKEMKKPDIAPPASPRRLSALRVPYERRTLGVVARCGLAFRGDERSAATSLLSLALYSPSTGGAWMIVGE